MNLANPWMLNFLWVIPVMIAAMILSRRRTDNVLTRVAEPDLFRRLTGRRKPAIGFFKNALVIVSYALLVIALAGPRWGSHYQEVSRRGVDIMIDIDVSPSMLVSDVKPSRLERAKREVQDFVKVVQGDRIGLVAFSGAAFVQCPLTLDYGAIEMFLSQIEPGLIPVTGTDLGEAIERAVESFDFKTSTDKVVFLITDGEDNEGHGLEAAERAKAKGVKIFVMGIGETAGGPIPESEGKSGFAKDEAGKMVLSKLDEEGLKKIASITGGTYIRSNTGDLDLDMIYFSGIKTHTKAAELKSGKIRVYEERFTMFITAALVLLLAGTLLRERSAAPGLNGGLK
jgi:Ca-activated chloride channel family protein